MTGAAVPSAVPPAVPPLVLPLDDPGAVPAVAGGKGASLARLARAGFRVPPGYTPEQAIREHRDVVRAVRRPA